MLIDPFTVLAQIVNFAILAFVLKRLLYERVIEAMDAREASIAARLDDAADRESEAAAEAEALRRRREQFERDREELLDAAREDAQRRRQELLVAARDEVDEERQRWLRGLAAEQRELHTDLRRRTTEEVVDLSRRALCDLAHKRLDREVLDRAIDLLEHHDEARAAILAGDDVGTPLHVRTAFVVDPEERPEIIDRLRTLGLDPQRAVRFDEAPELVFGVEFRGDGRTVSWNADDYLERLDDTLDELIDRVDATDGR